MDCRWVATLFLFGCFSDPPSSSGGSTGEDEASSTGQPGTSGTSGTPGSSSSSGGSSSGEAASSSSGAVDSSGTTGEQSCPDGVACLMPAPPPWSGPVSARISDPGDLAPQCPPDTDEVWAAGMDPAASCDCTSCGANDITCDAELDYGANGFCDGGGSAGTGCQPLVAEVVGQLWLSFSISQAGGSCSSPEPGQPLFRRRAVACSPQDAACEGGGSCVAGPACIWQDGEHACPDPFTERTVLYASAEPEDLSCDVCECGADASFCDEATISLHAEAECGGDPVATPALYDTSTCAAYDDPENFVLIEDIATVDIQPSPPDCSSSLDTVPAAGTFMLSGPRTLCCAL